MSNKASSTRSRLSVALEDASQLLGTGAIGGAPEGHEASTTNDAVNAEFSNLAIVNNAQREANGSAKSATNAKRNTATVGEVYLSSRQVNVDISNSKKVPSLGTIPNETARARSSAIANNPVPLSNPVYNKPHAIEHQNVRVRVTRFSHCELCNGRDTSSMVQCDGCDLWYHFSCVEVTSGIANRSWICPACSVPDTRPDIEEQQHFPSATHPVDPPPPLEGSRRFIGTTNSNRSNQRRITRRLQMLEEQKQLEQKYLEEKYRILDEEDGDNDTVVSDNEVGSMEMSKVRGWLIDTGRCGEDGDSGLVEEVNEQEYNPIDQRAAYMERTGPRLTPRLTHEFYPHQRSTPRELGKTRNDPLQKPSSLAPILDGALRRTSFNVVPDNQFRRPPGAAIQFCEQTGQRESSTSIQDCLACNGSCTSIAKCKRFEELSLDAKWAVVRESKLCRKCLRKHNGICRQQKPCGVNNCSFLHHPLLHNTLKDAEKDRTDKTPTNSTGSCNVHQSQTSEILFRIVPVLIHGPSKVVMTYAFIDDGSELTLMEESLAEELGVKGPRTSLCLKWTSGTTRVEAESQIVDVGISATGKSTKPIRITNVHTIESLQLRPQTLVFAELLQRFQHLEGLSIESYENVCPRILIGLDNASLGNAMKSREGKPYEPIAVKTRLGWIVYESCSRTPQNVNYVNVHAIEVCECNSTTDDNLHSAIKNYFALDSLGIVKPEKVLRSADEERAMKILETQTTQIGGRYETGLLWKFDNVRLPNSSGMAHRRWECLERRMKRDQLFADVVRSKMADYAEKGYVRRLTKEELKTPNVRKWFLPVFPVVNPNKPGKVRLVWDAAATAYGVSLNSLLLKGPDLLTSLLTVLVKFRQFRIAVCGDIREMYLQISLKQDVRLCFFWKDSEEDKDGSVYAMSVLPFGVSCAPCIAQYVKNINAKRFEKEHSAAVSAIVDEHYVDDMLTSVERKEDAVDLAINVKMIHAEAGFEMRNWISNCPEVLEALEEQQTEEKDLNMTDGVVTEKVLGMWWNTANDCFTFKISPRYNPDLMSGQQRPTKREVLRTLMMIFDPLGLIGHFLMYLKVVLQEIWRTSVGWDDEIEEKQFEMWLEWLNVLPAVAKVQIPRCYRTATSIESSTDVQLHIFVDASEKGFAAVVYLRFQEEQTIETALVGSKTRVAPIKFLSIPRSELQACVIGVRFATSIIKSLSISVTKRFFWTDSSDVISWLKSDHRRYSQFVAFRVSEILEASDVGEWQWIQTKQNVADDGTKWKRVPDMSTTSRWFNGPEFLKKPESEWPVKPHSGATVEELRPHLLVHLRMLKPIIDPQRFSKWTHLLRRVAYVFRFINNAKAHKHERSTGPLTSLELGLAEKYLYRLAQRSTFSDEVAILLEKRTLETSSLVIPKSSSIYRLCPFLDEDDVLRVRGRTRACQFANQDAVNPIILPRDHHITRLLVFYYHSKHHHQNHNTTINELRQRYSIPHLKATYNSIRRSCQQCKNDKALPQSPSMGDLPLPRLAAYSRPFTYMGVDYFGPYVIALGRRLEKRWVLLATCLTTRAIHLQIVHTLTTDSCIMALRNVMSRRGVPAVIYSDRGTNFQGASKELNNAVKSLDQERLATEFTTSHTSWAFIPPASPHMGGAWERLVRTVKQNLAKLKPNRAVSHEVLENMLTEIENVVNSRPMTDLPLDDDYSPVLTPNHFLLGSSNGLRTWVPFDDSSRVLKNSWKLSQTLANQFWKQWLRDYLPCITRRTKWFSDVKPIEINDLVIIVDPKFPRNTWPKGRVIGIRQGADHQVRSATVQTASGIYERPAVKLAVLDVGVRSNAV
ncbi:uncharacterized protein LOC134290744 [Aedes albopictus]|uniref:Uncharacterized protein n=1 Tax=Aedes albopictus TaxID=7160 RepID=A0ABM1ZMP6_AEDAL